MPAAKHDIYIEQGAAFLLELVWTDSEGVPIDLTDFQGRMQLRGRPGGTILIDCSPTIELGGVEGTITVPLNAMQTAEIAAQQGVYDLELHRVSNPLDVTRLIEGKFSISPEVTR